MTSLRPYQREANAALWAARDRVQSSLVVMATGAGKTILFCHHATEVAKSTGKRVLIVAHREELVDQAASSIQRLTGVKPAIERANYRADEGALFKPDFVVASVQTLSTPGRMQKFSHDDFSQIIFDEAHHATSASWQSVRSYFLANKDCRLLGVTATPRRTDGTALGESFDAVAYRLEIEDAIDQGWLVPLRQHPIKVEGLSFEKIMSRKSTLTGEADFAPEQLDRILREEKHLHSACASLNDVAGDQPTLVFCVSVEHAREIAEVLNRYKQGSAAWLCGDRKLCPPEVRHQLLERFRQGDLQYLCNCMVLTEGTDLPNAVACAMLRPTKSLLLYTQMLGRVTRTLTGTIDHLAESTASARKAAIATSAKPYGVVYDLVGISGHHKIIAAADVLGGHYAKPVRERAARLAQEKGGEVKSLLDEAAALLEYERALEERARKRAQIKADEVKYRVENVSPFATNGQTTLWPDGSRSTVPTTTGEPATAKQVGELLRLGFSGPFARSRTKKQASALIAKKREELSRG